MMKHNVLYIYTDGSYYPDTSCGGWAALLWFNKTEQLVSGNLENAPGPQHLEVLAALEGLKVINPKYKGEIVVVSDSLHLVECMTFKRAYSKTELHLFHELRDMCDRFSISWEWVKGHNDHIQNEIVDRAARREARNLRREQVRP